VAGAGRGGRVDKNGLLKGAAGLAGVRSQSQLGGGHTERVAEVICYATSKLDGVAVWYTGLGAEMRLALEI
jgi:hypothetical protein